MNQARIHKLQALKNRLEVIMPKLPSYTDPGWVVVYEICAVLEALIDMAIRQEL